MHWFLSASTSARFYIFDHFSICDAPYFLKIMSTELNFQFQLLSCLQIWIFIFIDFFKSKQTADFLKINKQLILFVMCPGYKNHWFSCLQNWIFIFIDFFQKSKQIADILKTKSKQTADILKNKQTADYICDVP